MLLTLVACGGSDTRPPSEAAVGALAYVVTECRDTPAGFVEHQALRIRRGDRQPVTALDLPDFGPQAGLGGYCEFLSQFRFGDNSVATGAFTRLAITPDGSTIIFEVTDAFSSTFPPFLAADQKGLFLVRADGSGLRRLAPASREAPFTPDLNNFLVGLSVSPDGRLVAFADQGPGPGGTDAAQIATLDLVTGARTQVTRLPAAVPRSDSRSTWSPFFLDSRTIGFFSRTDPFGSNPDGEQKVFTIGTDGTDLQAPVRPVAVPGAIDPRFVITGDRVVAGRLVIPGTPVNHIRDAPDQIGEIFAFDGQNVLQLTNFHRVDTGGGLVDVSGEAVYIVASANLPATDGNPGDNPFENCQIFSVGRNGGDLRQLTHFDEGGISINGCDYNPGRGCASGFVAQDPITRVVVFSSSCDVFGTNGRGGGQVFAMRPDGTDLRQLTDARGTFTDAGGVLHAELPGPSAYGPHQF